MIKIVFVLCSYSGFAETYIGRTIKSIANTFNTKFELHQVNGTNSLDNKTKY